MSFESSSLADSLKLDGTYGGGANGGTTGSNSDLVIKQEPSGTTDAEMHAMAKDRQKKDNHNMSTFNFKNICIASQILQTQTHIFLNAFAECGMTKNRAFSMKVKCFLRFFW